MPTIELRELTKTYGSAGSGEPAVDHLDLTIPDGAFMCLLGPSGCGKTTTLRMIAGLEQPTGGEIRVGDRVLDSPAEGKFVPAEKRNFGLVFQSYALWPHMTVRANTEFGLRMRKVPRAERTTRVDEVLELMRIGHLDGRYPSQLSGGQQQRVALARMLAANPEVLLLDEPLSNLDARLRLEMRAELKRLHDELNTTIVFVTHDQYEAMTLGTHVAVMHDGVLQQAGPPMDVYARPANVTVARFVGSPPMNLFAVAGGDDPLGWRRWLAGVTSSPLPPSGWIGARPDAVRIGRSDLGSSAAWTAEVTVESVLPTGPTSLVQVAFGEHMMFAEVFHEMRAARGDRLACTIAAADFHVFDEAGDRVATPAAASCPRDVTGLPA